MTTSDMAKITNQEIESLADYPTLLASGYTAEQIHTIRKTVGADVKNMSELALFLTVAKQYKLDPLAREICMIAFKGKNSVFCTRDGFLKIANGNDEFEGINSMDVRKNDGREGFDYTEGLANHTRKPGGERGPIVGAWAICHRVGRRPVCIYCDIGDYDTGKFVWASHKASMIRKVVEVIALKRQFSISGIYSQEEMSMSMEIENKKNKDEVSDDQLSLMREGIEAYEENDHECNDQCDHDKDPEIIDGE